VYILSTTVIQGIVPNAELAESTGPFGLAYAKMFGPTVGTIVMALAAMACVGSLLGWQFTLAQTAKDAADTRMFPAVFGRASAKGAPIMGMVIMGIVQSVMALSTISPNLSEQFAALVNLAVVTNVVPYIVSLSALFVMMRNAGVDKRTFRVNACVGVVATLYSTYALYASGMEAVMGGMLVMAIGYIVYGFIAPRFVPAPTPQPRRAGCPEQPRADRIERIETMQHDITFDLPVRRAWASFLGALLLCLAPPAPRWLRARSIVRRSPASSRSAILPKRGPSPSPTQRASPTATRSRCAGGWPTQ